MTWCNYIHFLFFPASLYIFHAAPIIEPGPARPAPGSSAASRFGKVVLYFSPFGKARTVDSSCDSIFATCAALSRATDSYHSARCSTGRSLAGPLARGHIARTREAVSIPRMASGT